MDRGPAIRCPAPARIRRWPMVPTATTATSAMGPTCAGAACARPVRPWSACRPTSARPPPACAPAGPAFMRPPATVPTPALPLLTALPAAWAVRAPTRPGRSPTPRMIPVPVATLHRPIVRWAPAAFPALAMPTRAPAPAVGAPSSVPAVTRKAALTAGTWRRGSSQGWRWRCAGGGDQPPEAEASTARGELWQRDRQRRRRVQFQFNCRARSAGAGRFSGEGCDCHRPAWRTSRAKNACWSRAPRGWLDPAAAGSARSPVRFCRRPGR